VTRPDSKILEELLAVGRDILRTPASAFGHRGRVMRLRGEVDAAVRRPSPDGRAIDDIAAIMVTALAHICLEPAARWERLAAFLLPCIEEDYRRALERELRTGSA
jgi:hypothetical protein